MLTREIPKKLLEEFGVPSSRLHGSRDMGIFNEYYTVAKLEGPKDIPLAAIVLLEPHFNRDSISKVSASLVVCAAESLESVLAKCQGISSQAYPMQVLLRIRAGMMHRGKSTAVAFENQMSVRFGRDFNLCFSVDSNPTLLLQLQILRIVHRAEALWNSAEVKKGSP